MTITKVSVQAKNKDRSNIYLDDKYYCSLDNLLVIKYGLKAGTEIEEASLAEIQSENETGKAFDLALSYITRYRKTKKQISDYLYKKGYLLPVIGKVMDKLSAYGFADDEEYASSYVEDNRDSKGRLYIKRQLIAKGISEKCAENAVKAIEDEKPAAFNVAAKYMKNKICDRAGLSKCYRYLLSKGFSFDSARSAIDVLKAREAADFNGEDDDDYTSP